MIGIGWLIWGGLDGRRCGLVGDFGGGLGRNRRCSLGTCCGRDESGGCGGDFGRDRDSGFGGGFSAGSSFAGAEGAVAAGEQESQRETANHNATNPNQGRNNAKRKVV